MKKRKIIILSIILAVIVCFLGVIIINKVKTKIEKDENQKYSYINGEFNFNLIKTVNENRKTNYLISPYSIEIALNMLKDGADGNTKAEIEKAIGTRTINNVIIKDHIGVANAAFIKNEYKQYVKESYYNTLKDKYQSEILYDEFKTPKVINNWVNDKTNGMIDKILDQVDEDFVLGLANALAIDVEWDSPFECISTTSEKFVKANGKTMETEMMHKTFEYGNLKYIQNKEATGIIIPYKKYDKDGKETFEDASNLEFVAILPKKDINIYINNLDNDKLNDLYTSAKEITDDIEIDLSLPRFKYNYELENFKEVLMKLGIKDAFDPNDANFTNIMDSNDEIENIYVGEAIHKTHIDLNEKGTKAAAVTYFGMYKNTAMPKIKEKIEIKFDKPFIYMIKDTKTNEMLFFGVVYEPNEWNGSTCSEEN